MSLDQPMLCVDRAQKPGEQVSAGDIAVLRARLARVAKLCGAGGQGGADRLGMGGRIGNLQWIGWQAVDLAATWMVPTASLPSAPARSAKASLCS